MNPATQLIILGGTSSASGGGVPSAPAILMETSGYVLLEDGTKLLLE